MPEPSAHCVGTRLAAVLQEGLDRHGAASGQDPGCQQENRCRTVVESSRNLCCSVAMGRDGLRQAQECLTAVQWSAAKDATQRGCDLNGIIHPYVSFGRCWRCLSTL